MVARNVLILTAGFGDGHDAAASSLRDALEQVCPEAEVTVADVYERSYKRLNHLARKAYLGAVRYAPALWAGIFKLVDRTPWLTDSHHGMGRVLASLAELLQATQPDCVVCTYPTYPGLINTLFRDHCEKPFRLVTVITDARSINSVWYRSPSDRYVVCDTETAKVLARAGVPEERMQPLGFPVSPRFAGPVADPPPAPRAGLGYRVLYVINTGKKKLGKSIDRLLELPNIDLTITVGRHAELKEKLAKRARRYGARLHLLGWTNQMPELMMRSHLIVGKAGGAAVQEALAARCPLIINQVIPGQEEGNARLVEQLGVGIVADKNKEVARAVERAFADNGALWREWRARLEQHGRPDASLRIARLVLDECELANHCSGRPEAYTAAPNGTKQSAPLLQPCRTDPSNHRALLCDFHIHTNYSDGKLTVPEVVDFYGSRGFDCICITDHWTDPRRLIGKLSRLTPFTLSYDQIEEYFEVIAREAKRAWRRYWMLVLTGLEFNKDGPTKRSSAHLLGIDLKTPISPRLDLPETVEAIHAQGGLAVASHPHVMKSEWTKDTLYLWENQDRFAPLIDAWEIANRNNLFTPVSLKRLPFLANSDFHKPKHIYSWKTLLHCEKEAEAIKRCIRLNERISITLYRDEPVGPSVPALAHAPRAKKIPAQKEVIRLEALSTIPAPTPELALKAEGH
ncbi:MAG TPA: PHP domain-containing protein [Verrucomicrobiae bacterium]|nr:PHP domain-containing protein [Verrucomicrobiae bacterium]